MTVKSLLDIETGAFELADTPMVAVDRFYDRLPDAQPWVILIGHEQFSVLAPTLKIFVYFCYKREFIFDK